MRILILGLACTLSLLAVDGEKVYKEKCASCHSGYIPMSKLAKNFIDSNNTLLKLKAPTLNQISYRLKHHIGDMGGDEEMHRMEVEAFVADYLDDPRSQKSICRSEIMKYFDTMPSMKGKLTEDEIDAVSNFIYDYDDKMIAEHSVKYKAYDDAIREAKREHKLVIVEATSRRCHYCKKMDREVLADDDVADALRKDFIVVKIDLTRDKLPLNLKVSMTPTFFFVNREEKVIKTIPGSWSKDDFLEILHDAISSDDGGKK